MAFTNNIFLLLEPFIKEIQNIEFVIQDITFLRSIDNSEGQQLDNLGIILDVPRLGDTDADYRLRLQLKIVLNRSSGQPEAIISFLKTATKATDVKYDEIHPASIHLDTNGIDTLLNFSKLPQIMQPLLPAGVLLRGITFIDPVLTAFAFDDEGSEVTDGLGFSETGFPAGDATAGAMSEEVF